MPEFENGPQKHDYEDNFATNGQSQNEIAFFTHLKSIQNLVMIATIAGPASLLIGGVLLGSIAIICGAIALHKLKNLCIANQAQAKLVGKVRKSAITAIVISVAAIVVNVVFVALMMPEILSVIESGDVSALQSGGPASPAGTGSSSIWG